MPQDLVTHSMRKCSQAADGILVSRKTVTDMIDTQVFKTLNIPMENWLILLNNTTGTFDKKSLSRNTIDNIFHELGDTIGQVWFQKKSKGQRNSPHNLRA